MFPCGGGETWKEVQLWHSGGETDTDKSIIESYQEGKNVLQLQTVMLRREFKSVKHEVSEM